MGMVKHGSGVVLPDPPQEPQPERQEPEREDQQSRDDR